MSSLTVVYYDSVNNVIFITGFSPFPARSLASAISSDNTRVIITDFAGSKIWAAIPFERLLTQTGSTFTTIDTAQAYCASQFTMAEVANNGPTNIIEYVASESGPQTVTLTDEAGYVLVCINGLIQLTGGVTYSHPTVVLSGDLNVDIGDSVTVIVF